MLTKTKPRGSRGLSRRTILVWAIRMVLAGAANLSPSNIWDIAELPGTDAVDMLQLIDAERAANAIAPWDYGTRVAWANNRCLAEAVAAEDNVELLAELYRRGVNIHDATYPTPDLRGGFFRMDTKYCFAGLPNELQQLVLEQAEGLPNTPNDAVSRRASATWRRMSRGVHAVIGEIDRVRSQQPFQSAFGYYARGHERTQRGHVPLIVKFYSDPNGEREVDLGIVDYSHWDPLPGYDASEGLVAVLSGFVLRLMQANGILDGVHHWSRLGLRWNPITEPRNQEGAWAREDTDDRAHATVNGCITRYRQELERELAGPRYRHNVSGGDPFVSQLDCLTSLRDPAGFLAAKGLNTLFFKLEECCPDEAQRRLLDGMSARIESAAEAAFHRELLNALLQEYRTGQPSYIHTEQRVRR